MSTEEIQQDATLDDMIENASSQEVETQAEDVTPEVTEQPPELEPLQPLEAWQQDWKDKFNARSREAQEFILELNKSMQGDYTRKTQELAEQRKQQERIVDEYNQYQQALAPISQMMQMQGVNPIAKIAQYAAYEQAFAKDPTGTLMQLAKQNGVDLHAAIEEQPYEDPQLRTQREQLEQTQREFQEYKAQQEQAAQMQQQQAIHSQIEQFSQAKDANGQPLRPYFEQVQHEMARQITASRMMGQDMSLDEAYNRATLLSPEVQTQIQEQEKATLVAQKQAEAKKAQNAADRITSNSKSAPKEDYSLDDIISSAIG
jgi:hypothetical protein